MKILITGAGGMLGHDLVNVFVNEDIFVADLPEWDITKIEELRSKIKDCQPDIIINSAAYTDVEGAEDNKNLAIKVNAEGVNNLSLIANELDIPLLHISTEYVFDGENQAGYNEDSQVNPKNAYGQSKAEGERSLIKTCHKYYLVRTSWLFGKAPQKGKPRGKNFIDKIIELGLNESQVKVVNDQFGHPTYTKDLALGIKSLVEGKFEFGIYHLVNNGIATWHDLAKEAFTLRGIQTPLIPVESSEFPTKVKRPKYSILNNNKLPKLRTWQEAVKEYLEN